MEIELAVASGRNIVPIAEESVDISKTKANCPEAVLEVFARDIPTLTHSISETKVL